MRNLAELASLKGRVALVTGGAGHIGSVICDVLAELGAHVCVLDTDEVRCAEVVASIGQRWDRQATPMLVDLGDDVALQAVPQTILDACGRLDILVNCAALVGSSELKGWATPFAEQRPQAWRLGLDINLTAPFVLAQACAPALKASGAGSVINISSIYGMVGPDMSLYEGTGMGNVAAYAASKGGLLQLTRWLSTVLAPDVRVNAVSVGGVWRGQPDEFQQRYVARTPLGRMATEEDLKGPVAFLAGDQSCYMTGQNLVVDGGWTAW